MKTRKLPFLGDCASPSDQAISRFFGALKKASLDAWLERRLAAWGICKCGYSGQEPGNCPNIRSKAKNCGQGKSAHCQAMLPCPGEKFVWPLKEAKAREEVSVAAVHHLDSINKSFPVQLRVFPL